MKAEVTSQLQTLAIALFILWNSSLILSIFHPLEIIDNTLFYVIVDV